MTINTIDGPFSLDCWLDPNSDGYADQILYSENIGELRAEALRLIRGGRYKMCELYRYDFKTEEWEFIETFDSKDA